MSKVIRDCIGFVLLRSVIGLENSRHFLNQSDAKLKPIATWSLAFSRAYRRLLIFALSSDWLLGIFPFVLIGRSDYFGFGFTTLNRKALYQLFAVIMFHCFIFALVDRSRVKLWPYTGLVGSDYINASFVDVST